MSTPPVLTEGTPGGILKFVKRLAAVFGFVVLAVALRPALPEAVDLIGPLTRNKILENFPGWRSEIDAYTPLWAPLDRLRSAAVPVRIELFLSTSDAQSRTLAGRIFKILDQTGNPNISAWVMGLPGRGKPLGLQAAAKRVDKTPTLIVLVEGREAGRIVGLPELRIEEKLASLFPEPPPAEDVDDDLIFDMDFFRFTPHTHLNIDCTECHSPRPRGGSRPGR